MLPATERVLDCLDVSAFPAELRDSSGVSSAAFLKEVLDRIELPDATEIPDTADPEENIATWTIPGTRLILEKSYEGPTSGGYLFSAETLKNASKSYRLVRRLDYRSDGPPTSPGFYDRFSVSTKKQPKLALDTSSPRGTLNLFLSSVNELHAQIVDDPYLNRNNPKFVPFAQRIVGCLDLSETPEYARDWYAGEAAVCLKEILDRIDLPTDEEIPGAEDLGTAEASEGLVAWQVPNSRISITKVVEGPRRGQFLFSPETVASAPELFSKLASQPYRTQGRPTSPGFHEWWLSTPANATLAKLIAELPDWMNKRIFGMAIWQWLGLALLSIAALAILLVGLWWSQASGAHWRSKSLIYYWLSLAPAIASLLVPFIYVKIVEAYLTIRSDALYATQFIANLAFLLASLFVILSLSSRLADSALAFARRRTTLLDAHLIKIICRILGIVAATLVFLEGGRYLGFPLTTLLASAGIGGLAIALSAQGMVRGLFGTVTVLFDKPYQVGDRIVVNGFDGTVEEVGLRSTKLREFQTGHLVTIPNDHMAETEITNIGKRSNIRRVTNIRLPLDTPRIKVQQAVAEIRGLLKDRPELDPQWPPRIYFDEIDTEAFNIRILYWVAPPDLWEFYRFNEQVNFELFEIFEDQGIQFSLPQRHSFWKTDDQQGPLDVQVLGSIGSER